MQRHLCFSYGLWNDSFYIMCTFLCSGKVPIVAGKAVDLALLYHEVVSRGGEDKVRERKMMSTKKMLTKKRIGLTDFFLLVYRKRAVQKE